jgi:potassium efflux system protein
VHHTTVLAMIILKMRPLIITCLCYFISLSSYAQTKDTTRKSLPADTQKINFVTKMQAFAKKSAINSAAEFNADKATIIQNKILEEIKKTMQKAKIYLKTGIDTLDAKTQLNLIDIDIAIAGDGVFANPGSVQTYRNLTTTSKILAELLSKAKVRKLRLDQHQDDLTTFRYQLDSLLSVSPLFKFPTDSVALAKYMQKLVVVAREIHPIDSALKQAGGNVQSLLNQYNLQVLKLQTSLDELDQLRRGMASSIFDRELDNIWGPSGYYRPFKEIVGQAQAKSELTLLFYVENNSGKLIVLLLLIFASFTYLQSLKSIYIEKELLDKEFNGQLGLRYPLLTAILLVVNLFQFIFFSPPFVLSIMLWSLTAISLTFLFRNYITSYWMKVWLAMVFLFWLAALDNLILQASRTERWFMLIVSVVGIITGLLCILQDHKKELREKLIIYSIGLMTALELASTIANIFGRYNLSKTLFISGFLNVVIAILFLWTVRLINEGLYLAFNVYTQQDKKLFYLNFDKVGNKAPTLLYVLLIIGWCVLVGRNFPGYEYISGPLRDFFSRERNLGDYTFSIINIVLFVAIIGTSVIISKIVSYFAADRHFGSVKDDKSEKGIGSWLLLIRIGILSIGLFLAIAAAGIPIDKITIVLGALGVGIGFGLQTLVNNLVSGLIIAFEKPVNVGDIVDVDGQGGTMKSIGFRSSVISTWDGADVVMPNGDLLNSHLTNWSLGGGRKRGYILIGVAYDADLEKVKTILTGILNNDDRIMKSPGPVVQYEQFNNSAIDVRIYFWTRHIKESFATRSDLIMAIKDAFSKNGISIPFPQQDVYLHDLSKRKTKDN